VVLTDNLILESFCRHAVAPRLVTQANDSKGYADVAPSGIAHRDGDRVFDPAQRLFRLADGRQIPSAARPAVD
jgi:hypothetical protein